MSDSVLADQSHRDQALDITQSFTVQAPAGSGKTELLTLRYLKLLGSSALPEEVLAITFTRKAASEMRDRIVNALIWASDIEKNTNPPVLNQLETRRLEIVRTVLSQDRKHQWHLLDNPARLRVQTIDSFCYYLSSQLPVISRLGGGAQISEEVHPVYIDAVRATLDALESDDPSADDISLLLQHLDNDVGKVERLLTSLLHMRDQWLPYVLGIRSAALSYKDYLHESLDELIVESLEQASAGLFAHENDLVELLNYSASNLSPEHKSYIPDYVTLTALPIAAREAMPYWSLLTNILLTEQRSWRKRVDVTNGFPPGDKKDKSYDALCKSKKAQISSLLETLAMDDELLESLLYIRKLSGLAIDEPQWTFLAAIARILVLLNAKLLLSFRKFRTVDYTQVSAAARDALFNESMPSDLALALDYKIQHILVDEFQDTSKLQIDILQQLTAGWQPGDGRTLFVVGDATQSCYGFRNAKVGLFIHVRAHGLGELKLAPLTLQTNFRSQAGIVTWVNQIFRTAFPLKPNSSRGAVPYTESVAFRAALAGTAVNTEIITHEADATASARQREAQAIVEKIGDLRLADPQGSIAILVRSRTHLGVITAALRDAGIQWQSTDIDRLASLPIIKDLANLCRALLNLADRVAWLALLRAPWCGLTIADLHAIESYAGDRSICFGLQNFTEIPDLTPDARGRLQDLVKTIDFVLAQRYRCDFKHLVETAWQLLRGPSLATSATEQESIAHFFQLLSAQQSAGGLSSIAEFEAGLAKAFVPSKTERANLNTIHLLTMHKAKGLEYDHVILPCLGQASKNNDKQLLLWHERQNETGEFKLFMATLSAAGSDEPALYKLLRFEQRQKELLENTRLLYIAVTRAKKSAWLLATLSLSNKGEYKPQDNSLLQRIWPQLQRMDDSTLRISRLESAPGSDPGFDPPATTAYPDITPIKRFRDPVRLTPRELMALSRSSQGVDAAPADSTSSAEEKAALTGTLIHRALEAYVQVGSSLLDKARLDQLRHYWRRQLRSVVADAVEQDSVLDFIETSISNCVSHGATAWVFNPGLQDSRTEIAISSKLDGYAVTHVIDRSFIDASGVRWIIDYKTAVCPQDMETDRFIHEQISQHRSQLANYQRLFLAIESRPSKTALLFTSIPRLVELNELSTV